MELRRYWKLLTRRWLLVLVPAAIVLVMGIATYDSPPPVYNVGVRFIVGQRPSTQAATTEEERYYNWLTSEYIVNGLTDWVKGGQFAAAVSQELVQQQGLELPPGAIQGGLVADNERSMLTLSLTYGDAETLAAMMDAAITVLREKNAAALPQLGDNSAVLVQLDQPVVNQIPGGIRRQLDLPLRVLLALATGVGLALLVEYLDPTIRDRAELDTLGLPVMGEIPKK
jgi:capsular polysaccharide biosynthesis protein